MRFSSSQLEELYYKGRAHYAKAELYRSKKQRKLANYHIKKAKNIFNKIGKKAKPSRLKSLSILWDGIANYRFPERRGIGSQLYAFNYLRKQGRKNNAFIMMQFCIVD